MMVIGVLVGCLCCGLLVGLAIVLVLRRRAQQQQQQHSASRSSATELPIQGHSSPLVSTASRSTAKNQYNDIPMFSADEAGSVSDQYGNIRLPTMAYEYDNIPVAQPDVNYQHGDVEAFDSTR
jgi:hypothetical protein